MEKTKYIKPEIDVIAHQMQSLLDSSWGNKIEGDPVTPPPGNEGGTDDTGNFARQHNNWMWDTMEEEF